MEALGLLETKGLLVAIEGADAMLKAAEVTLLEKTYVGGGLVSIAVTGGVAAVKAAVEAGAAAVKQINAELLISQHVIPRPHEDVNSLIGTVKANSTTVELNEETAEPIVVASIVENTILKSQMLDLNQITKDSIDKLVLEVGLEKTLEELNYIKVSKLRSLAREYTDLQISGRRISKADKKTLMTEIELHYK